MSNARIAGRRMRSDTVVGWMDACLSDVAHE